MLMPLLALAAGLALLVWSAERFVDGAIAAAHHLRLPPLVVGTVIVGIGTSAPEFLISGLAAWDGRPGLAIGNAYGSNVANIGLILGCTLLLSPMWVPAGVVRRDLALLAGATLLSRWLIGDGVIGRLDAVLLLLPLLAYLVYSVWHAWRSAPTSASPVVSEADSPVPVSTLSRSLFWLVIGLAVLITSSRLLIWGAVTVASVLGVSDLVIGLTVVAIGTSLPELASSISAIRRNAHDLVLGNVVGSNLFNTLGVVGVAGLITPIDIDPLVSARDWPVMAAITFMLFVFAMRFGRRRARLNRVKGALLLSVFVGYNGWLVMNAINT